MSESSEWETVRKNKKNPSKKQLSKSEKKKLAENMPRKDEILSVQESPTIYQMFLEEEMKKERSMTESEGKKLLEEERVTNVPKKKIRSPNLKECLSQIENEELGTIMEKDKASFPKNPEIWLKDWASFINSVTSHISDNDPVLAKKNNYYPLSELEIEKKDFIISKIKEINNMEANYSCLEHCIESLTILISKGDQSALGYRVMIQIFLHSFPQLFFNNLSKFETLLHRNSGRPIRSLAILWSVGQAGLTSLQNGVKVWFDVMFPLIAAKNINEYVVSYLQNIFRIFPSSSSSSSEIVSKTNYFKFFGEVFSEKSPIPPHLLEKLYLIHQKIRELAFGPKSENCHFYFPTYLFKLNQDSSTLDKNQLLESLLICLEKNSNSWKIWQDNIHKYPHASRLLLKHIKLNITKVNLDTKKLSQFIDKFKFDNKHARGDLGDNKKNQYPDIPFICEEIQNLVKKTKKNKNSFFKTLFVFLLLPSSLFVCGDIYYHGNKEKSITFKTLSSFGLDSMAVNSHKWLNEKTPDQVKSAFSSAYKIIQPSVKTMFDTAQPIYQSAINKMQPIYQSTVEQIQPFYKSATENIQPIYQSTLNKVNPFYQSASKKITPLVQKVVSDSNHVIKMVVTKVGEVLEEMGGKGGKNVSLMLENLKNTIGSKASLVSEQLQEKLPGYLSVFEGFSQKTLHFLSILLFNFSNGLEHLFSFFSQYVFIGPFSIENIKVYISKATKYFESGLRFLFQTLKQNVFDKSGAPKQPVTEKPEYVKNKAPNSMPNSNKENLKKRN